MGKLAIFIFASWAGVQAGGVITGLVLCGVVLAACSAGTTLMQDFRTGWIVKSAPRAMFVSQVAGGAAGALLAPITFLMFWNSGEVRALPSLLAPCQCLPRRFTHTLNRTFN